MTPSTSRLSLLSRSGARWLLIAALVALAVVPDEAILRPKITWGRALLLSGCCLLLASQALAGRLEVRWRGFLGLASLLAVVAALRMWLGPVESSVLARDEVARLALLPAAAWLTSVVLDGPRWRRRAVLLLALAGIWVGGFAVLQRLGGLVPVGVEPAVRAEAGFGNPVFLGAWLVLVTPLLLAEGLAEPGPTRWPSAVAAGLCLPALLGTGSAGAWLGFGVACLVAVLLIVPASRTLYTGLAGLGAALLALIAMHPHVLLRPRTHGLIWRDTLAMAFDRLLGVGPGQFQIAFLPYASGELLAAHPRSNVIINDAHSEGLQIFAELGLPGLLVLLWATVVLVRSMRLVLGAPAERAKDAVHLVAAVAAVAGALIMSFVSPDLRFEVTTILLGVVVGFIASYDDSEVIVIRGGKLARLGLLAVAGLGLLGTVDAARDQLQVAAGLDPGGPGTPFEVTAQDVVGMARLRRDAEMYPDNPAVLYDLAVGLASLRRYGEASDTMARLRALTPDNASVIRTQGMIDAMAGRFERALESLTLHLATHPDDTDARYLLAYSAFGEGDVRTAIRETEALLRDAPDHPRGRLLLQRLRE